MATIICLKDLKEKGELEYKDIVEFTVEKERIKYKVWSCFLNNSQSEKDEIKNDEIFKILKIDKMKLAEKIYDYKIEGTWSSNNGYWPKSNDNDFPALTNLVAELYKIIEKKKKFILNLLDLK